MVKAAIDFYIQYQFPTTSMSSTIKQDRDYALKGIAAHINKSLNAKALASPPPTPQHNAQK